MLESLYTSTRKVRIMTEDGEYHNNSYEKGTYVVSLQVYMIIINLHSYLSINRYSQRP